MFVKLLSSFLEYQVLVAIPDRYGFEFPIKGAERKHQAEDSTHTYTGNGNY